MSEEENTHFHNNFDESAEATQGHASASPIQNEPVSNPHCQTSETLQQNNDVEVPQDKTSIPITSNEQVGSQHSAQPLGSTTKPITERFYIDMFEEDIAVVREEHKLFRKYCIRKDLKIKSCLQEALNEETEGGLTDDRLKKRDTAMKKLTQALKSYLRRCSRVRGMIDILEKHCQQANGLRGNAECSKVAMTLEKDLDLFKEFYRVKNEKLKKHEIEIAQEEFKKQRSFVNEIYRLQKQEILLDEQLKATEANLDYYAKTLDEENLKVNGLEAKFKETNDSLSEIKEKDMRNQECRDEKNKIIMQLKKELQAAESTSSKQLQDLQTQKTYTDHWHNQFQQQLLNAQECTWKFEKSQTVCRELEREKNSLVLRLSKIAGDNLTYQNPNIADLGDPKRPTKLAEVYNELYDNEWTDAFDKFGDFTDTEKVHRMLAIMKSADDHCDKLYMQHTEAVRNGLTTLSINYKTKKKPETDMQKGEDDKNETTRQTIKPDTNTDATREERDVLEVAKKDEEHPIASSTNIDNYTEGEQITNANDEDDPATIDQTDQEKNSGVDARESRAPLTQQDGAVKGDGKSADNDNQDQNSGMNAHSNPDPLTQLIDYEEKTEEIPFEFNDLNNTQKQAIADIGRFVQNALEKKVVEVTSKVIVEEIELPEVAEILAYVRKCVTICWSARRHDPPVYIDFMEVKDDTLLDLNVYKPYTKKGKLVDYVVWPPIYLHKGGPMLSKGVAQGKNKN